MSFSSDVKEELNSLKKVKKCCIYAELSAMLRSFGRVGFFTSGKPYLYVVTENWWAATKVFTLIKKSYNIYISIKVRKNSIFRGETVYILYLDDSETVVKLLRDTCLLDENDYISAGSSFEKLLSKECCKKSYLRGLFISNGTITDPLKSYQMEISFPDEEGALKAIEYMSYFNIHGRLSVRKGTHIVYLKEAEGISDMLSIMGAHKKLMEFENARIVKEVRNSINRKVNCETANIGKTVDAFEKQRADIEYLQIKGKFDSLSDKLKEVAELRLQYPESSLEQLGEKLDPPLGKSGINHRLRRLSEIAENLRKTEPDYF